MTDDKIAALMNAAAGQHWGTRHHFLRFAYMLLAAEREACAKVVDHILKQGGGTYGDAIRARGTA
jgi:hypothetical protein